MNPTYRLTRNRHRQGMVLVQMALAMPILILMFSAIVQFGGYFFLQNRMMNATRDVSRRVAVGELTEAQAQSQVQADLADWGHTFTVTVTKPAPGSADRDCTVRVSVPRSEASMMDILGLFQKGDLVAEVTMRLED